MSMLTARGPSRSLAVAVGAGLAAGAVMAVCFYVPTLNSAAHLAGPWVALGVLAGLAATWPTSVARSAAALMAGMIGFYVMRWVAYRVKWGAWLSPLLEETWHWTLLGGLAGVVLGSIGCGMRSPRGVVATWSAGAALALLAGDALVYWHRRGADALVAVAIDVVLALLVLRVVTPQRRLAAGGAAVVLLVPALAVVAALSLF